MVSAPSAPSGDVSLRLFRPPPLRARRPRGGPQAPGHVHRVDRLARPHALPLGDHRQLGRRGARRARQARSRSSCTPTAASRCATGRGIPVDIEPKTGSLRRRGRLHQAARGRQVRRRARTRPRAACTASGPPWSTPSPSGSTSRSTATARPGRCRSTAASPASFADRGAPSPERPFTPFEERSELRVVGKVAKGVTGTRIRYWADRQIFTKGAEFQLDELPGAPARPRSSCPGSRSSSATSAATSRTRRRSSSTAASPSSSSTSRRMPRSPTCGGSPAPAASPRPCRCCTDGAMVPTELSARLPGRHRAALGHRLRHRDAKSFVNIIATPKGGTHQAGLRAGAPGFLRTQVEQNARRLKAGNDKLEKDDVLAGLTGGAHGAPARAAVRGPDEGGPRHPGGALDRREWCARSSARGSLSSSATTRRSRRSCSTRSSPR